MEALDTLTTDTWHHFLCYQLVHAHPPLSPCHLSALSSHSCAFHLWYMPPALSPQNECTFAPNIGVNKHRPQRDGSQEAFITRMHRVNLERDKKLDKKRRSGRGVDTITGQPLFKPVVGRGYVEESCIGIIVCTLCTLYILSLPYVYLYAPVIHVYTPYTHL